MLFVTRGLEGLNLVLVFLHSVIKITIRRLSLIMKDDDRTQDQIKE